MAPEGSFGGVRAPVAHQALSVSERAEADVAHVRPLASVSPHVFSQVHVVSGGVGTQFAAQVLLARAEKSRPRSTAVDSTEVFFN